MKNQNNVIKIAMIVVLLITLVLFMVTNFRNIGEPLDTMLAKGKNANTLNWQERPLDLVLLLFFLISGALASLRVLPHRKEDEND